MKQIGRGPIPNRVKGSPSHCPVTHGDGWKIHVVTRAAPRSSDPLKIPRKWLEFTYRDSLSASMPAPP